MAWRSGLRVMAVFLPLALGWAAGASAIPITRSFEFEAVDLRSQIFDQGVFEVTDPVFGSVTVVIDPDGPAIMDAWALSGFVNVTSGGPVGYNYLPDIDELVVGGLGSGVDGAEIADFRLRIGNASTLLPTFLFLTYNESREYWIAGSGRVTLVGIAEPGTVGLFGLGVLLTLALLYRCSVTAVRRAPVRRYDDGADHPGAAQADTVLVPDEPTSHFPAPIALLRDGAAIACAPRLPRSLYEQRS